MTPRDTSHDMQPAERAELGRQVDHAHAQFDRCIDSGRVQDATMWIERARMLMARLDGGAGA